MDRHLKSNWLLYIIVVFAVSRLIMYYQFHVADVIMFHGKQDFTDVMCKWDCKWYLTIINNGYDDAVRTTPKLWKGLANWAFFPLYPLIVACVKFFISINPVVIGIVLNQLFVLIASIMFYKLLNLEFDDINSRFGATIMLFSPFSIYFTSLYTEALFLCISVTGFYFIKRKQFTNASLLGGLLAATRPVGIMFMLPLFIALCRNSSSKKIIIRSMLLASSGLLLFMIYLQFKAGDFLAFQHIQKGWGRRGWDVNNISGQLWKMFSDYHNSTIFIISFIASLYLFIKKYYEEAVFNLACILPGVLTGTMMSEGRFSGTLFTLYFALVVLNRSSWSFKILSFIFIFVLYISYYIYWMGHTTFLI